MGQDQSQEPQESQSDPDEPSQPDSTSKIPDSKTSLRSPDMEGNFRRVLWRDGGWIGGIIGSDTIAKTVWYQNKNIDQGASEASNSKEMNSKTVWYDNDERKPEQLEKTESGLSSPHEFDKTPPQLLEQGLSSHQLCSALSQPHAAGEQPAPSHGLAAQRQEVQGSQREEEAGPDWQEGGEEGESEVRNRETTHSRKSSETANLERGGEEKPGGEEKEAKGRKKRKKKRGKRGGTEAKLSSSSSIESQSQSETQTEQVTNLKPQSETGSEAKDQTGRPHVHSLTISEPAQREEADKDAMHLPSQTESQTRDSHETDCAVTTTQSSYNSPTDGGTNLSEVMALQRLETKELSEDENVGRSDDFGLDSTIASSELNDLDIKKADTREINIVLPIRNEVLDSPTMLDLKGATSPTGDDVASRALSENESRTVAVPSVDQTESTFPKKCPVKNPEPVELTEDLFLVAFPEENAQCTQFVDRVLQPVDSMEKPNRFLVCSYPTEAVCLPCEGTADVTTLQIREGSPEMTEREYLEHCLSSEMLRDHQHKKEKIHELQVGEEEAGKEKSLETTSEENDCGVVRGEELSSTDERKKLELLSLDEENVQKYNEDLVATAVAVVTVAVASAMARIELNQQLAGKLSKSSEAANIPTLAQDATVPTEKQPKEAQTDTTDRYGSNTVESLTAECEADGQAHQQDNPEISESKTEENDSCFKSMTDTSHLDCLAEEEESDPQPEEILHEGDSRTLPLSHNPTLPVTPCDSPSVADPSPEKLTAPANMDSGELELSQSLKDPILVAATFQSSITESVAVDGVCDKDVDTMDGWKHRERKKLELEKEAREDMVMEEDTSHTGK